MLFVPPTVTPTTIRKKNLSIQNTTATRTSRQNSLYLPLPGKFKLKYRLFHVGLADRHRRVYIQKLILFVDVDNNLN